MTSNNEQLYFIPATPGFSELEYISEDTGGPGSTAHLYWAGK
jgi:hypothetical protein